MSHSSTIPKKVENYKIYHDCLLGRGKYGDVWVGQNTDTNTEVAVKRVTYADERPDLIDRELDTLNSIQHPNVVKLLDQKVIKPHVYLIFECCECDLQIFAHSHFPEFASLKSQIIQDSTSAVKYLHARGVIHCDIKPGNILLKGSPDGWIIKVADFGLAMSIPADVASGTLSGPSGHGTVAYMAPEVLKLPTQQRTKYKKSVDVFSLGLLILAVIKHTGGRLQYETINGKCVGEWIKEQLPLGVDEEEVEVPGLVSEEDSGIVLEFKKLVKRMVRSKPSSRLKIVEVYSEIERINQLYPSEAQLPSTTLQISVVTLTKLQQRAMPQKPPKGLISFGLGLELDILWIHCESPEELHYSKYQDGNWIEVWTKELPDDHEWRCKKYVNSSSILLQTSPRKVCFYSPQDLQLMKRVRSPGFMFGLTDQGLALVSNNANPTAVNADVKLHLAKLENLQQPEVELKLAADKAYGVDDFLYMCVSNDGHVAITNAHRFMDLFSPDGQHIKRVDLMGKVRRASCTERHLIVPVRKKPPMIKILSWGGEVIKTLWARDLGLKDDEFCWSSSPVHDGKLHVFVTDANDQEHIVTYQIQED